jgi:hypothetical protein
MRPASARRAAPASTIAGHFARLGIGRLSALEERPPVLHFERERLGELLHLDTGRLARFERVGRRITGDRCGASDGLGWEVVHVAVDDASRLAYVVVLPTRSGRRPASWSRRSAGSGHEGSGPSG